MQPAIAASQAEDQVWVAAGTYYPTNDGDRTISFAIKNGTEVYGGFAGGETELAQRDWINNQVILSGNIGSQSERNDNSVHVVTLNDTSFFTIFDGFTITDGYAVRALNTFEQDVGGGIYAGSEGNAEIRNLIVANNFAVGQGGGAYFDDSNINLTNVAFFNNNSDGSGGGFYASSSGGEINNSLFINNRADNGGAISGDFVSTLNITNSTLVENQADTASVIGVARISGGDGVNLTNSIVGDNPVGSGDILIAGTDEITVNQSIVRGGFNGAGQGIIDAAPLFVDPENNNYSLQAYSPAVDAGNNTAIESISTDLVGNSRINNETVDLGAYEFVLTSEDINENPEPPTEETPEPPIETPPENNPDTVEGESVYRFFIPDTGVHFYTVDETERDGILETQPDYVLEGTPYNSAPANDSLTGVAPIYRFLNTDTGVRIYTISEVERDSIETLSNYESEGIAYYGYTEQLEDTTPVFRFYNPVIDAHFYTSSPVERDSVIENLPDYQLERNGGIAFYVEPIFTSGTPNPTPPPSDPMTDLSAAEELGDILNGLLS